MPWFKKQHYALQGFLRRLMDFLHHWWMGALLFFYTPETIVIPGFSITLNGALIRLFGLGLFLDDMPDIPPRFQKFFRTMMVK